MKVPFAFYSEIKREILSIFIFPILIILIMSIGFFQFVFKSKPYVDATGKYIYWNPDFLPAFLTTWGLVGVALVFAVLFLRGGLGANDDIVKIKSLMFSLGAISLANSAYYIIPRNNYEFTLSFYFAFGGVLIIALGLVVGRMLKRYSGVESSYKAENIK